jgi:small subunit ribosomal protein S20
MANIKSAKKRINTTKKKTTQNRSWKQKIRVSINTFKSDLKNRNDSKETYRSAQKTLDRASSKGIIHKRKAAKLKAKLSKML